MNIEFKRNCPQCGKEKIYTNKYHLQRAIKNNSLCSFCSQQNLAKQKLKSLTPDILKKREEKNQKYKKIYWEQYYKKAKDKINERKRVDREKPENKQKIKNYRKVYSQTNRGKEYRKRYRLKKMKDPIYRLNNNISNGVRSSLKDKKLSKKRKHWEDIVGYTVQDLKEYIGQLFKSGMSWNNYGKWEIDHILPIAFFKYKSMKDVEFRMCWRLENLQPLWSEENLLKRDKILLRLPQK